MFGKSKENRRKEEFHKNMDGEYFYQNDVGIIDVFNEEQKKVLLAGMRKGYMVKSIAYPFVSADCMKTAMCFMSYFQDDFVNNNIKSIDIYETVMVFKDPEICYAVLTAKKHNVDIFKEFDDVRKLEDIEIEFIASASEYGLNVCQKIKDGMTLKEIEDSVKGKMILKKLCIDISDFLYFLKYPDSELKRLKKVAKKKKRQEEKKQKEQERAKRI